MPRDEEIVAADPVLRRRYIIIGVLFFVAASLAYVMDFDPVAWIFERLFTDVDELRETDQEQARERARDVLIGSVAGVWIVAMTALVYMITLGVRMWRASQWPLPNARLIADTKVIKGSTLRIRAALGIGACFLFLVLITYYVIQIIIWVQQQ